MQFLKVVESDTAQTTQRLQRSANEQEQKFNLIRLAVNPTIPLYAIRIFDTLQQKQLAEFNGWLFRWNNYQQHLATYWQGRYNALYAHTMTAAGGGKAKKTKSGKVKGNKTEMNWMQRYQERECCR